MAKSRAEGMRKMGSSISGITWNANSCCRCHYLKFAHIHSVKKKQPLLSSQIFSNTEVQDFQSEWQRPHKGSSLVLNLEILHFCVGKIVPRAG